MEITFYNYGGYSNKLNKTLSNGYTVTGNFNISYDTSDCIIKIAGISDFNYNYCYVKETNRYYFVTVNDLHRNNILFLHLHIDVLQTYAEKINNAKIRLSDDKTNATLTFNSEKIVNDDFINIMVTIGGV